MRRESFFPKENILADIISSAAHNMADYVTFVGDGEPTLNKDLGWLIRHAKDRLDLPVAVITNGSLLSQQDVREDLGQADVIIPTLDAGNETTFRAVNRPHRSISFDSMLQGQINLRREYPGQIWTEVMLVKDLNDLKKELQSIRQAIDMIEPDRVYVLTPIRPPAESWVKPSNPEDILRAQEILGGAVSVAQLETGQFGLTESSSAKQAITEIGARHPLRSEQAAEIEAAFSECGVVRQMLDAGELIRIIYNSEEYLLPSHFVLGREAH